MEFFRNVNVDWMSKKWYFLGFSLIVTVAGLLSIFFWHGIPLGVDFRGGTIITVKFSEPVHEDQIRDAVSKAGVKDARIQSIGPAANSEFIIALEEKAADERALDSGRQTIIGALNNSPFAGKYQVRNVDIVGPQVGKQLQSQAFWATMYSLAGMLIYLWFRFELIYGVAAVVAVFHDTLFTLGVFSLTNTEISLTVIAAILTLIGYSMNDTIVVFDRIRENLKLSRRESMRELVNKSINQTLSRTILTSGLTFLTVISLYLFGGQVLHGFSFALVIGILIGTYSSIAVAAPMLVAYQESRAEKQGRLSAKQVEAKRDRVRA
ncbi:MAG: Protein-export rane protein SecF [Acidobacteriaceae bacterium]|nr:Protein-export rane protein SecF [Acidobacteriaceae bacterium]